MTNPHERNAVGHDSLLAATAQIVSAHIAGRAQDSYNLLGLMADVYGTLQQLARPIASTDAKARSHATLPTMVAVEDSVNADYLVCLEDGKRVKMLKRHLKTAYNMSPEQYRARWNLPASYPMVAPNYAKVRSQLAKQIGLGRRADLAAVKQRMDSATLSLR
jgi:predicted transcriptional regulator